MRLWPSKVMVRSYGSRKHWSCKIEIWLCGSYRETSNLSTFSTFSNSALTRNVQSHSIVQTPPNSSKCCCYFFKVERCNSRESILLPTLLEHVRSAYDQWRQDAIEKPSMWHRFPSGMLTSNALSVSTRGRKPWSGTYKSLWIDLTLRLLKLWKSNFFFTQILLKKDENLTQLVHCCKKTEHLLGNILVNFFA